LCGTSGRPLKDKHETCHEKGTHDCMTAPFLLQHGRTRGITKLIRHTYGAVAIRKLNSPGGKCLTTTSPLATVAVTQPVTLLNSRPSPPPHPDHPSLPTPPAQVYPPPVDSPLNQATTMPTPETAVMEMKRVKIVHGIIAATPFHPHLISTLI